ncbi:MAG TPA: hypothetical protein VNA04_07060 [Thermoanaerobaculia bacterium]|nr:hypothetical protein [Thermoanaerobaculia bacterium]
MNRRVRSVVAVVFALILVLQAPVASAAIFDRNGDFSPRLMDRIVRTIKKVLKPLAPVVSEEEDPEYKPTPPKP